MPDEQIERVLEAYALRIADLKRDARFKYVAVFKNQGPQSGEEWSHSHSQVTATTFVPRRILYELRAAREWFRDRERCVFCDILRQEVRQKKRDRGHHRRLFRLLPIRFARAIRNLADAADAQPPVRSAVTRRESAASREPAGSHIAPLAADY